MRGLEIRCTLAMANVVSGFDQIKSTGLINEAMSEANELGFTDAKNGIYQPPFMFKDDSELLREWRRGQIDFEVDLKISEKEMA